MTSPPAAANHMDASIWSCEQVSDWLKVNGLGQYADYLCNIHRLDGQRLLNLTRNNLIEPPLAIGIFEDLNKLLAAINWLKEEQVTMKVVDEYPEIPQKGAKSEQGVDHDSMETQNLNFGDFVALNIASPSPGVVNPFPSEKWKTMLSWMFCALCMSVSACCVVYVNDVKPPIDPLPDVILDNEGERVEWAFQLSEYIGIVQMIIFVAILIVHKHRFIAARRGFFLCGVLYIYRSITMLVTNLPVPSKRIQCAPITDGTWTELFSRMVSVMAGLGLKLSGRAMCGDYVFSGHTTILLVTYLMIVEYSPPGFWLLRCIMRTLTFTGVMLILIAHEHYTLDIILAYYVTTRLFWIYHDMAQHPQLKRQSNNNYLSRAFWFRLFMYFEQNVGGVVPNEYEWPFRCLGDGTELLSVLCWTDISRFGR